MCGDCPISEGDIWLPQTEDHLGPRHMRSEQNAFVQQASDKTYKIQVHLYAGDPVDYQVLVQRLGFPDIVYNLPPHSETDEMVEIFTMTGLQLESACDALELDWRQNIEIRNTGGFKHDFICCLFRARWRDFLKIWNHLGQFHAHLRHFHFSVSHCTPNGGSSIDLAKQRSKNLLVKLRCHWLPQKFGEASQKDMQTLVAELQSLRASDAAGSEIWSSFPTQNVNEYHGLSWNIHYIDMKL